MLLFVSPLGVCRAQIAYLARACADVLQPGQLAGSKRESVMRSYIELIGNVIKAPEIRVMPIGDRFALLIIETTKTWHDRATGERRSRST